MTCYFPLPAIRYRDLTGEYRIKVFPCQDEKFTRHSSGYMIYSNNGFLPNEFHRRSSVFNSIEEHFYTSSSSAKYDVDYHSRNTSQVFTVPCSKCIGCRQDHARNWSIRCYHESLYHTRSCFVTLTYNDSNLPSDFNLERDDLTKFMKRLRKRYGEGIRYIACGEYGDRYGRPHYHILLFGLDFTDLKYFHKPGSKFPLYTSKELHKVWTFGNAIIGKATREAAGYICRYTLKKNFSRTYTDRVPEFLTMSRRGGIGLRYFKENFRKIFPVDTIVMSVKGVFKKFSVPPYYLRQLKLHDESLYNLVKARRLKASVELAEHNDLGFFHLLKMKFEVALSRLDRLPRVFDSST